MGAEIGIIMVQLLFTKKPQSPTAKQLHDALEKYMGDLGEVPYAEPSKDSKGDMFMFPLNRYKAILKDKPEGVPVMATFLSSEISNGIQVDDMKRHQFWDVPNGNDIINNSKYTVLVNTMMGAALSYKEQAEIILAQVSAALDCYPDCIGIYTQHSGKLITPAMFEADKQFGLSERFIKLCVNARFFTVPDSNEMVVDTLGFHVFGGADVQVHFKNMDPNHVVCYVYNLASYQFDANFPIKNGDTIDSIDQNGRMQVSLQWKTQYEESLIDPVRTVLDINCGEYAGGNRTE